MAMMRSLIFNSFSTSSMVLPMIEMKIRSHYKCVIELKHVCQQCKYIGSNI